MNWSPLVRWTFRGHRFRNNGLDLRDLPTLIATRALLLSFALRAWRAENPERERAPKNYSKIDIQFFGFEKGSTIVVPRVLRRPVQEGLFGDQDRAARAAFASKFDESVLMLSNALGAMADDKEPEFDITPRDARNLMRLGTTLRGKEFALVEPAKTPSAYSKALRDKYGFRQVRINFDVVEDIRKRWQSRISALDHLPASSAEVTFSGVLTGTATDHTKVTVELTARGRLSDKTDKLTGIEITNAVRRHDESLTDGIEVVSDTRVLSTTSIARQYIASQLGDGQWGEIAQRVMAVFETAAPSPQTADEIMGSVDQYGYSWEDVHSVLMNLSQAPRPFVSQVFYYSDRAEQVDPDVVSSKIRQMRSGDISREEWERWATTVVVGWVRSPTGRA
jgi:hypothetical protein